MDLVRKNTHYSDSFLPYFWTAIAIALSYLVFTILFHASENAIQLCMVIGLLLCCINALKYRDNLDTIIFIIIIAGMIMRIGYMLYTPFTLRGHDIGSLWDAGHYSYMYNLLTNGSLPLTNNYQYYQPPFQHLIQAGVVKIMSVFQPGADANTMFDASKIVPCFASSAILWVSASICREIKIPKPAAAIAMILLAFSPTFYLLSANVNNDSLMLLFFMLSVLFTIRWYYKQSLKNILLIALFIGLGMMTKISGGMAALFTGAVFIIVFIQRLRQKNAKKLWGGFAAFLALCLPLALWYPLRNYIKFGQPLGYVYPLPQTSDLYCGGHSFADRFLTLPADQLLSQPYCQPYGDYNLPLYTLKSSLFGEYTFDQFSVLASALIIFNLVLIVFSFAAMIYVMVRCRETNQFVRYGLFFIWLTQILSFIFFNLQYPFGCTMDFRYIRPALIVGAIYTGVALVHIKRLGRPSSKWIFAIGCVVVCLFAVASIFFYTI